MKTVRILICAFFVAALSLLASPSAGRAATAGTMCAIFDAARSATKIDDIQYAIKHRLPARYARTLDILIVKTVDSSTLIGPVLEISGAPTVQISKTFLHDQCLMTVMNEYLSSDRDAFGNFRAGLANCTKGGTPVMACFRAAAEPFVLVDKKDPTAYDDPKIMIAMRSYAVDAATFLIAHEIGHLIQRFQKDGQPIGDTDEEFEADIFAQIASLSERPIHPGPLFALAMASVMEDYQTIDPSHDDAACRLIRTSALLRLSAKPLMDIGLARGGLIMVMSKNDNIMRSTEMLAGIPAAHGQLRQTCDSEPSPKLVAFLNDVEFLGGEIQALASVAPDHRIDATSRLLDHAYASSNGRMLGLSIAVAQVVDFDASAFITLAPSWPVYKGNEPKPYRDLLRKVFDLARPEAPDGDLSAAELSRLLAMRAMVEIANSPAGSDAVEVSRRFVTTFKAALSFDDEVANIGRDRLMMLFGDAEFTIANNKGEFQVASYLTFITANVVVADCATAARYARTLGKSWNGDVSLMSKLDDPKTCRAFHDSDGFKNYFKSLGWKYKEWSQ
ncbi:MAG: hypothetical protein WDN03_09840 [Rhizomicrobium sp.]